MPAGGEGRLGNVASATQTAQTQASQAAAAQASQQKALQGYASTAIGDLNSGNYAGAWDAALQSSTLYNTNYNSTTTDPLLQALESGTGLQALDPSKKWDANSIQAYYTAMEQNPVYQGKTVANTVNGQTGNESFGKNPYGDWGSGAAALNGTDVKANLGAAGDNSAPDVQRFAGAKPTKSFLSKYGTDIAMLAAAVAAPELIGALAPALGGTAVGATIGTDALAGSLSAVVAAPTLAGTLGAGALVGGGLTAATDAITGKPLTAKSVLGGALGGAAGGGLTGYAGNAINGVTGLGSTVSTGLAGAGIGAARSALNGGNVGLGALTGGIGGAVQGSGVAGTLKTDLTNAGVNSGVSNALVNGGLNYAVGGATGALAGALIGNGSSSNSNSGGGASTSGSAAAGTSTTGTNLGNAASGAFSQGAQGAQGNNGNMASTDSTLASTLATALPGVLQAGSTGVASMAGANARVNADQNAITTQQNNLGNINNIWSNQQQTGQGANTALQSTLGLNGQSANYSNFNNSPGYQFAVQQGTQAIQRQAASMGNAYTPNTAAAVGQYVTGTASQNYNNYVSQLMGAAGLGSTANTGLQTAQQNNANNVGQLQQNIGNAQAAGYSGVGSAASGLFGASGAGTSLIGAAAKYLGGGSGGVGSTGSANGAGGASGVNGGGSNYSNDTGYSTSMNNPDTGTGNGTWDSGVDPSTGSSWASNSAPTFDPNSVSTPTMPSIDTSGYNFGGSLDYGSSTNDLFNGGTDFLGGF